MQDWLHTKMNNRFIKSNKFSSLWEDMYLPELDEAVKISIITKCPSKYVLIDMETGQVYRGTDRNNPYVEDTKLWEEQKRPKEQSNE